MFEQIFMSNKKKKRANSIFQALCPLRYFAL